MTLPLRSLIALLAVVIGLTAIPVTAQSEAGYGGFIQSGSCAAPTDEFHLDIDKGKDDNAFQPYTSEGAKPANTSVYFGIRTVPGFGPLTLLGDASFSMAIIDASGTMVACGEITVPKAPAFVDQGLILVGLGAVNDSGVTGVAIVRAAAMGASESSTMVEVILLVANPNAIVPVPEAIQNV